jgi:hypothetical protein
LIKIKKLKILIKNYDEMLLIISYELIGSNDDILKKKRILRKNIELIEYQWLNNN